MKDYIDHQLAKLRQTALSIRGERDKYRDALRAAERAHNEWIEDESNGFPSTELLNAWAECYDLLPEFSGSRNVEGE